MTEMSKSTLDALILVSMELERQIMRIKLDARFSGVNVYSLRTPTGDYVLAPLLTAQANALAAVAQLQR